MLTKRYATFLVIAKDFPNSLAHRMKIRPQHLQNAKKAKEDGLILLGGATLSNKNEMDGSMMVFEADDVNLVQDFIKSDPYTVNKVWKSTNITEIKLAAISTKLKPI